MLFVNYYSKKPLETPISLNPAGKITEQIEIRMPEIYELDLSFSRENHDFKKLDELIGGGPLSKSKTGVIIPIKWSLTANESKKIIFQKEVQTHGAHGWTKEEIYRSIDNISIFPGTYTLIVEILHPIPEFQGVNTKIEISHMPKNSTTWHTGYMWWGTLFNYLISPLLIISLLIRLFESKKN